MAFVKDFKKIQKKPINYKSIVKFWDWNKNTEKFENSNLDWQKEIDKNKHIGLKQMLERNIKPQSDLPFFYGDASIAKDKNLVDLYNIANVEVQFEKDAGTENVEKSKDQSTGNSDNSKKDAGTENVEKSK